MTDIFSKKKRSEIMGKIRPKGTKPEVTVRKWLHGNGFRFRLHRRDLPGQPDIVLPKHMTVIFVDGCFWHGHHCDKWHRPKSNKKYWCDKITANKIRDHLKDQELHILGWNVIRIWECETKQSIHLMGLIDKLLRLRQ